MQDADQLVRLPATIRTDLGDSSDRRMMPLSLTIPPSRPAATIPPTSGQSLSAASRQKFHRPFEVGTTSSSSSSSRSDKVRTGKVATVATAADNRPTPSARRNGESSSSHQDLHKMSSSFVVSSLRPPEPTPASDDLPLNLVCRHSEPHPVKTPAAAPVTRTLSSGDSGVAVETMPTDVRIPSNSKPDSVVSSVLLPLPLPPPPVPSSLVSRIDRRIQRRQSRRRQSAGETGRQVPSDDEDEDDDSDTEMNDVRRHARLTLITSGPPLKQDAPAPKRKFLEAFELITPTTHSGNLHSPSVFDVYKYVRVTSFPNHCRCKPMEQEYRDL